MRDPSIHVRRSDLAKVLNVSNKKLDEIISDLRKVSCDNRAISITNDKLKKDVARTLNSTKGDANLMADIIYSTRIKLKHRGINKLKESDRDWLQVKELAKLVNKFCEEFELGKRAGYIKYIEMCFPKINSMRSYIGKFISMYETICSDFDSLSNLANDKNPKETTEIHDLFVNKVADRTGIYESYIGNPNKMMCFYKAKELCQELGTDMQIFIDAQFEALEWCSGIPTPEALFGDKAKERLNKYLFKNNIIAKPKVKKDFWNSLKK